jgi:hypothetical protein
MCATLNRAEMEKEKCSQNTTRTRALPPIDVISQLQDTVINVTSKAARPGQGSYPNSPALICHARLLGSRDFPDGRNIGAAKQGCNISGVHRRIRTSMHQAKTTWLGIFL